MQRWKYLKENFRNVSVSWRSKKRSVTRPHPVLRYVSLYQTAYFKLTTPQTNKMANIPARMIRASFCCQRIKSPLAISTDHSITKIND